VKFAMLEHEEPWQWFKERTHVIRCEDTTGIIAYDERGIQGMCVADSFSVDSCNVHFCIPNPMSIRAGIFTIFADYIFDVRGVKRMFGLVPDNNEKAIRLDKKLGFREVARVPDAISDGVGYVVMRIDRDANRWRTANQQKEAA